MHIDDYEKLLARFGEAWNAHDADLLMSMMTEDCIYRAAAGAFREGETYRGTLAVRQAYLAIFDTFPDARWEPVSYFVHGNRGVSEWRFTGTTKEGQAVDVMGCDLFELYGGKIAVKDSYRKSIR